VLPVKCVRKDERLARRHDARRLAAPVVSGINGRAQAVVGRATLVNTKLDPAVTFDRLAEAVNPFRKVSPSTDCNAR
jgi:hypothetical protein